MELKWMNPDAEFERLVLAIDVGGTNTNIGLVAYKEGKFTLVMKADYASGKISGLEAPSARPGKTPGSKTQPCLHQRSGPRCGKPLRHDESHVESRRRGSYGKARIPRDGRKRFRRDKLRHSDAQRK